MKWITVQDTGPSHSGKTRVFLVRSKEGGAKLGDVKWYAPWRKYVFQPTLLYDTVFEQDCLRDIAAFIELETQAHKNKTTGPSGITEE